MHGPALPAVSTSSSVSPQHSLYIWGIALVAALGGLLFGYDWVVIGGARQFYEVYFHLSSAGSVGWANSCALIGCLFGSLAAGTLADRYGRRRILMAAAVLFAISSVLTGWAWSFSAFIFFRILGGAAIGLSSNVSPLYIAEISPAAHRGRLVSLNQFAIVVGILLAQVVNWRLARPVPVGLPADLLVQTWNVQYGWRWMFTAVTAPALVFTFASFFIPESPRWLMTHHRADEGTAIVDLIEEGFRNRGRSIPPVTAPPSRLRGRRYTSFHEVLLTFFNFYPRRTLVGFSLMAAQAFFYNAIFFTYALVLTDFFHIRSDRIGWYILTFAVGNFFGPLALGWAFDTVGRRPMIALTYAVSGLLLAVSGALFALDAITANQQTAAWMVVFFFASAAASSAYLTVSEIFPLEIRALAIAVFYAIGTGIGGMLTPWLFGALIDTGSRTSLFIGYLLGSALMIGAAAVEWCWGIAAEGRSLESVARPLTFTD